MCLACYYLQAPFDCVSGLSLLAIFLEVGWLGGEVGGSPRRDDSLKHAVNSSYPCARPRSTLRRYPLGIR